MEKKVSSPGPMVYSLVHLLIYIFQSPQWEPSHDRRGIILILQAEPLYLVNKTGRSPGIPEDAVSNRLTHCHSSLRHGTHTVGFGIVYQGLLLWILCVLRNRVTSLSM
jgi:hypothetical protein